MAVEIPVYVDIQGSFDRAVQEIPKEMPKLEKVLSRYALNMKIDLGGGNMNTVRNLLTDTTMTAEELEHALRRVRKAFDDAVVKGASKSKTSATVNNLAKAYGLLEQRVKGFYNANNVSAMRLEDTIAKINFKIVELKTKLAGLAPGTDQFNKFNYELKIQQQRLAEVTRQQLLYKAGVDASNKSLMKQGGIVKQLTGYFGGLYAAHTVLRFVRQVRDVTGELEYQRVALGHLLGDMQFGNELFGQIIEAAKESPFRIKDLVTYTKQLAAYRIEEENLYDTTMRLADISAGLGVDMNRLILAYGQVRAASVLRGQELRQFTEAGIPLVDELAKKFTKLKGEMVTTADVFKLISERAVLFEYIKEIFEDLTNAGGMFYKMQEEQAKTLRGRWEKLKDAYDQALMSLGEDNTFQSWNDSVLDVLNGVAKNLKGIVRVLNAASVGWIAYKVATNNAVRSSVALVGANAKATVGLFKMFGATGTLRIGLVALRRAWDSFTVAVSKNWVGIALSALATLATYFLTFKGKAKDATDAISDMQKAIEKMKDANKEFEYSKGLISGYEELAKKTDRTANENERLATTMEELKRLYPEITGKIDDENLSLEKQMELLGSVSEKKHADAVEEAKKRLVTQNELIRKYEDEAAAAKVAKEAAEQRLREAKAAEKAGPIPLDQRYGPGTYASAKDLADATGEAAVAAKQAEEAYDEVAERLAVAKNEAEELKNIIDPKRETKNWQQWAVELKSVQDKMLEVGDTPVFDDKTLGEFTSVYKFSQKLKKEWTDLKESIKGMRSEYDAMTDKQSHAAQALNREIEKREKTFSIAEAWRVLLGLDFSNTTNAYVQDPFIKQMENRMKFMKDFQSGYEKLQKYMSSSAALGKESKIMLTRGMSLGIDPAEQQKAAEGLSKWYEDTYNAAFDYLKKTKGVTGTLQEFLSRQITGNTNRDKMLKDFQSLIQSLFDAKTDFDTAQTTKNIENALKRVKDEIKRSETARSFYQDILGLTGDEELAASMSISVYGSVGQDFKDRIKKELVDSLSTLDAETFAGLDDKIRDAFDAGDYEYLAKNIKKVPEALRSTVQQVTADAEKFSADQVRTWIKELAQFKTYGEKRVQLAKQTAQQIEKINASGRPKDVKDSLILEYQRKEAEEAAKLQYEAFKDTPMYIHLFENLDAASTKMLTSMRDNLIRMKENWKDLDPTQLREMQKRIEEIDSQLAAKNPFKAIADGIRSYREQTKGTSRAEIESKAVTDQEYANKQKQILETLTAQYEAKKNSADATEKEKDAAKKAMEDQAVIADKAQETANASAQTAKNLEGALKNVVQGADNIDKWTSAFSSLGSSVKNLMSEVLSDEDAEAFAEQFDGVMGAIDGLSKAGGGIAKLLKLDFTGIIDIVSGVVDSIAAIFGASNAANIRRANKAIEQQQKIIDNLERSYQRLEDAMDEAFGTDYLYNYRKELEIINAEVAAYRAQAAAERSKGKKADEDKAKEYEQQAEEAMERIKEAGKDLQSFFAGSDLASAAQDFSSAWLDAYREFGNTAGAIEDRMEEMVKNLVEKAALSSIVQNVMGGWYESLKGITDWNAKAIAEKVREARDLIPIINDGLNTAAAELQTAGLSLRGTVGQFTGISRDYAAASEESINGLAAGVNTQNFFLQHLDMNVAAILSVLTGGASTAGASVTGEAVDPYKDQMLLYASNLPQMRDDLAAIRIALDRVIKPSGNKYAVQVQM